MFICTPTGTGKTALAKVLSPLGYSIAALGYQSTFSKAVYGDPKDADLLIFTPEKADLILRIEHEY